MRTRVTREPHEMILLTTNINKKSKSICFRFFSVIIFIRITEIDHEIWHDVNKIIRINNINIDSSMPIQRPRITPESHHTENKSNGTANNVADFFSFLLFFLKQQVFSGLKLDTHKWIMWYNQMITTIRLTQTNKQRISPLSRTGLLIYFDCYYENLISFGDDTELEP